LIANNRISVVSNNTSSNASTTPNNTVAMRHTSVQQQPYNKRRSTTSIVCLLPTGVTGNNDPLYSMCALTSDLARLITSAALIDLGKSFVLCVVGDVRLIQIMLILYRWLLLASSLCLP
jgi:hypothetical protein